MMITINGERHMIRDGVCVREMIETLTGSSRGSAVVLDDEVIPRSQWEVTALRDGQVVELITAVPGGLHERG